jgi:hypothetical protein
VDFDHKAFLASITQLPPEEQRDRIIAERDRIHTELTEIKAKIAEAKMERVRSGRYADTDWWTRINAAAEVKGHQLLKLQGVLTKVTKEVKRQHVEAAERDKRTYERRFISAAFRILPRHVFDQLAAIAEGKETLPGMEAEAEGVSSSEGQVRDAPGNAEPSVARDRGRL